MAADFVAEPGGTFSAIPSDLTVAFDTVNAGFGIWESVLGDSQKVVTSQRRRILIRRSTWTQGQNTKVRKYGSTE